MATKENKTKNQANANLVGTQENALTVPKNPKANKKPLYIALIICVLVAAIGTVLVYNHNKGKLYAEVAGHKIYKKDVDNIRKGSQGVSEQDATAVLANKYLSETLAKEKNVTISDAEIEKAIGSDAQKLKTEQPYAYQNQVNQLYMEKLAAQNQGIYKGKLLVAHFSRYVPYQSALLAEDKAVNPKIGDPAAIAADKQYAKSFIDNLYNQISSGKLTFDQAIEKEQQDPTIGKNAYETLTHSGSFDTSNLAGNLLAPESAQEQISKLKPGETSKPFIVRVPSSDSDNSTAESYYLIVQMDSRQGGGNNKQDFDSYLSQAKKRLGYKIYE